MREAIIRLNNKKDDAELCIKQNEKITFKMLSKEELVKLFNDFFIKDQHEKANIKLFSENTIGSGIDYVVIKQPEHMQYVTYNNHSYKMICELTTSICASQLFSFTKRFLLVTFGITSSKITSITEIQKIISMSVKPFLLEFIILIILLFINLRQHSS